MLSGNHLSPLRPSCSDNLPGRQLLPEPWQRTLSLPCWIIQWLDRKIHRCSLLALHGGQSLPSWLDPTAALQRGPLFWKHRPIGMRSMRRRLRRAVGGCRVLHSLWPRVHFIIRFYKMRSASVRAFNLRPVHVQVLQSCRAGVCHTRLRRVRPLVVVFALQVAHLCSRARAKAEGGQHQAHSQAHRVCGAHVGQSLQAHALVSCG